MAELKNKSRRPTIASETLERIDSFLNDVPLEDRGALYAVIRIPQEQTPEVASLIQAVVHQFGKDKVKSALHSASELAEELGMSFEDLQEALIRIIEKRPIGVQTVLAFSTRCTDREAGYFIDRLGLDLEGKCALINAINDMEVKRAPGEAIGAREVAQFLEATAIELKKRVEPGYWVSMVKRFWENTLQRFEILFDEIEAAGVKPEDVNPEYAAYHRVNLDWLRRGRAYVQDEIARSIPGEIERMAPPSVTQLREFMTYLQSKISEHNWKAFLEALRITGMDEEGLTFSVTTVDELKDWKFQMERAALFLNPVNRSSVEINPFHNAELAVILHRYHRSQTSSSASAEAQKAQNLRSTINLRLRIANPETSDDEFKSCVAELIRNTDEVENPLLSNAIELIQAYRELQDEERASIIEALNEALQHGSQ